MIYDVCKSLHARFQPRNVLWGRAQRGTRASYHPGRHRDIAQCPNAYADKHKSSMCEKQCPFSVLPLHTMSSRRSAFCSTGSRAILLDALARAGGLPWAPGGLHTVPCGFHCAANKYHFGTRPVHEHTSYILMGPSAFCSASSRYTRSFTTLK